MMNTLDVEEILCIFLLKIWQTLAKTSEFKFRSGTLNGMNFGCHDIYTCSPFKLKRSNKWQRVPRKGDNSSQILLRTYFKKLQLYGISLIITLF